LCKPQAISTTRSAIPSVVRRKTSLDHPTVFNTRNGVVDGAAHAGKDLIEQYFPQAQILVFSPFWGWMVNTPTGA
jgi:hypothetical protein